LGHSVYDHAYNKSTVKSEKHIHNQVNQIKNNVKIKRIFSEGRVSWRLSGPHVSLCKAVTTSSNSTRLNWRRTFLWSLSWPVELSCIGPGNVITLKTQLDSTKSRQFAVSHEILSMFRTLRLTENWRFFVELRRVELSWVGSGGAITA